MGIGSLGFSEILVIAVIVLVAFGPRRMPEIGRAVGRAMREFRRSLNEIQREFEEAERLASPAVGPERATRAGAGEGSAGPDGAGRADGLPTFGTSGPSEGGTPPGGATETDSAPG